MMYKLGDQIRLTSVIRRRLSPELLVKIERTTRRYDLNNNKKGKIILRLLKDNGVEFRFLGQGTNRMGVQIDDFVFKIALDDDGHIDNKREFKYTKDLQPYVIKVYECTEDGLIAVTEMVTCFDDYDYMLQKQDEIRKILREVGNEYFIGDVGITEKNAANWGTRSNGELVMLDFAYIYSVSYRLFTCTCKDQEILQYDKDYNKLECPACHRIIDFAQIRRRISKADQANEIGDLTKQAYVLHKDVEFQEVNPEFSDVEEPEEKHKKEEDKKMSKKNKIHVNKKFGDVETSEQVDMMTRVLMGTAEIKKDDVPEEDDSMEGDPVAGERLMQAALMNSVVNRDEAEETVEAEPEPVEEPEEEEPENPSEYTASDYMSMASEMMAENSNDEDEESSDEEMIAPVIQEDVNSDEEDSVQCNDRVKDSNAAAPTQLEICDKDDSFEVSYNHIDLGYKFPSMKAVKARHTSIIDNRTTHPFSNTSLADKMMTAITSILHPVLICTGDQLDKFIFPSMIGDAISAYDTKRFKIVEIMGERETAPGQSNQRFFALYDLGHCVDQLDNALYRMEGMHGDYATADFVKCAMANVHMMLNCCTAPMDLDSITILGEDSTIGEYLATDVECELFHNFIVDDHNTTMAVRDDSIFTFDVGSWEIDVHDSDIPTMEDILDDLIPSITEDITAILNGYEGASADDVLYDVLNKQQDQDIEEPEDDDEDDASHDIENPTVAQIIEDVSDADNIGFDENFRIDTVSKG